MRMREMVIVIMMMVMMVVVVVVVMMMMMMVVVVVLIMIQVMMMMMMMEGATPIRHFFSLAMQVWQCSWWIETRLLFLAHAQILIIKQTSDILKPSLVKGKTDGRCIYLFIYQGLSLLVIFKEIYVGFSRPWLNDINEICRIATKQMKIWPHSFHESSGAVFWKRCHL